MMGRMGRVFELGNLRKRINGETPSIRFRDFIILIR